MKRRHQRCGKSQRIRLPEARKPLDKFFRRAVQCRDQLVVDRLHDRGHPNKVSMKKGKKGKEKRKDGGSARYL